MNHFSWISFTWLRSDTEYLLVKLINIYDRISKVGDGWKSTVHALETNTRLVVPLTGSFEHYIHRYFRDRGVIVAEVEREVISLQMMYPKWT